MGEKGVWLKAMRGSKVGFDRLWGSADKPVAPANKNSTKIGSEAFWPTSIDKESHKAARILRSFCKDGMYDDEIHETVDGPKQKEHVIKKIPTKVIKNAKGLAIFTTMRAGLWCSGAGGSGILVARMQDGTWSPPSGILVHTAALGYLVGVDIYDCVLVLNTQEAVSAFCKWRLTIGGEIGSAAGPLRVEGILEAGVTARPSPVFTYLRCRGFYASVQVDGTVVIERNEENEKFYKFKYSATEILSGKVQHPPNDLRTLMETLRAAQGDKDVDESALPTEPPPADFEVVKSDQVWGIPDREDPDPFGVLALEKEGFQIKEAGSQLAAPSEEFEFKPSATSPIFEQYNKRGSFESGTGWTSWRSSVITMGSVEQRPKIATTNSASQNEFANPSPLSGTNERSQPMLHSKSPAIIDKCETSPDQSGPSRGGRSPSPFDSCIDKQEHVDEISALDDVASDDEPMEEEPVIHEVMQAARPQSITRPRIVTVARRMRPELPTRNPSRMPVQGIGPQVAGDGIAGDTESPDKGEESHTPSLSDRELATPSDEHVRQESVTSPSTSLQESPSFRSVKSDPAEDRKAETVLSRDRYDDDPDPFVESSPTKEPAQKENSDPGPRISMMSMKLSLSDDDD